MVGALEKIHRACGKNRPGELSDEITRDFGRRKTPAQSHRDRHGGIIMAAGNMTAGKNHHHQDRADGQRRHDAGILVNHTSADREHQKKSADKLRNEFFHKSDSILGGLEADDRAAIRIPTS